MKNMFFWYCLVFMCHNSTAQVLTIVDAENQQPIEGVAIIAQNPPRFVVTNVKGEAKLKDFEKIQDIQIQSIGFKKKFVSYQDLEKNNFRIALEISPLNLEQVVISANRSKALVKPTPEKISVITMKEVRLQNPQTAADLLTISGDVFIQKSQQGGGSPMIRGFSTNRLLYTVDGVRMNTAIFRGGNLQNVISLDPYAMQSTEVLFGPGSTIYGSDAIGGVMSFQTLSSQLSLNNNPLISGGANARFSSANQEKTGHFDVNVGWKKWAILSSFSTNDYGDLKMGSHGTDDYLRPVFVDRIDGQDVVVSNDDPELQTPSGYSQMNFMQKIRFQPNDKWDFQYGFHYSETSDYSRYDRQLRTRNGYPRYGEWSYGPQKWMMNNLAITHKNSTYLFDEMVVRLAQQSFGESRNSRNFNSANREVRIENVDAYSINLDFNKQLSSRNQLFYGVEGVLNKVTSKGIDQDIVLGTEVTGAARYPQADWSTMAVYANNQFQVNEKLMLQAGLRYSTFSIDAVFDTTFYPFPFKEAKLDNGALTGSLGAVFRPDETWVISANFATGFRSPNVDDMGKVFDSGDLLVVVPNPDLAAEYAYNVDLGIAKKLGDFVKLDFTAYYTLLDNALVRRDFTLNGLDSIVYDGDLSKVQAIQNAAEAEVYGIQAGVDVQLPKGFSLSSRYNYQKGTEVLDDGSESPSRHAAPAFGVTRLNYHYQHLDLQFYAMYNGKRSAADMPEEEKDKKEIYALNSNGEAFTPEWYTLNFKAMYSFSANFSLSAGLENITDQRYRPYSSGISAPGRNFIMSLNARF